MGKFFLLLALLPVACKPLVRQSVSEITAISDARLALGIVPIQSSDGNHAYRMLLCKKAKTYSRHVLKDDSRCRVALLTREGEEVAFLPNQLRRDFATKYKGYAKQMTVAALAIVPVALLAGGVGAWRHTKKVKALTEGKNSDGLYDFTDDLINKRMGRDGYRYYDRTFDLNFNKFIANAMFSDSDVVMREQLTKITPFTDSLATASSLKNLEDSKRLIAELIELPPEARTARVAQLNDEIMAANNGMLDNASGSFLAEFDALDKRLQELLSEASAESTSAERLRAIANELGPMGNRWHRDVLQNGEIIAKQTVVNNINNLDALAKNTDETVIEIKRKLLIQEKDNMRTMVEEMRANQLLDRDREIGRTAGAGLAAGALLAIDRSIWGYSDRLVSKYWNQIFVANDDFQNPRGVNNVMPILTAIADSFGYVVNSRALQLAD